MFQEPFFLGGAGGAVSNPMHVWMEKERKRQREKDEKVKIGKKGR